MPNYVRWTIYRDSPKYTLSGPIFPRRWVEEIRLGPHNVDILQYQVQRNGYMYFFGVGSSTRTIYIWIELP